MPVNEDKERERDIDRGQREKRNSCQPDQSLPEARTEVARVGGDLTLRGLDESQ